MINETGSKVVRTVLGYRAGVAKIGIGYWRIAGFVYRVLSAAGAYLGYDGSAIFCYPADAGQDNSIIERAGGMASLVVADGDGYRVRPNPDHRGYQG